ncbi:MAG TPA: TonB family protein [Candidatus Sulfopaludibacter sp.]|nr:TonB family protein [Candidatus Sulfopaludibacter sp.]
MVKATLLVALGLAAAWTLRKSRASLRHALLAATFAALAALPVVSVLAPPLRVTLRPAAAQTLPAAMLVAPLPRMASRPVPASRPVFSMVQLLEAAWLAGVALFLAPMLLGLRQVRRIRRSALPWPQGQALVAGRRVEVLLHEELPGPITCGALFPAIILPLEAETWDAGDLNRAIVHELEHVRRSDWAMQCLARTVCAFYWFHPVVWTAWRRLVLEAERSCDDAVLGCSEATAYADQLVDLAQRLSSGARPLVAAMANRSDLATRVSAVLDQRQLRGRAGRLSVVLAGLASLALVLTISPFRMVAAPQTPAAAMPQFTSRTNLVTINATVTDVNGKAIDGLGARDFTVTEDGVVQKITTFEFHKLGEAASYVFGYYPTNEKDDGQYRRIQVIEKNDTTAKVEFRQGYYANKTFNAPAEAVVPLPAGTVVPVLIYKKEPEYSDAARNAKYEGVAVVGVQVDETGAVTDLKVLRSLGLGLDEKAIEAVKQWRFRPATSYGKPVPMWTSVRVTFRLL